MVTRKERNSEAWRSARALSSFLTGETNTASINLTCNESLSVNPNSSDGEGIESSGHEDQPLQKSGSEFRFASQRKDDSSARRDARDLGSSYTRKTNAASAVPPGQGDVKGSSGAYGGDGSEESSGSEYEDEPLPGHASKSGTYYAALENETSFSIATKLGLNHWKDLAEEPFNRKWYKKLRKCSKFRRRTLLHLPSYCRDTEKVKALYRPPSSDSEDNDDDDSTGMTITIESRNEDEPLPGHVSKSGSCYSTLDNETLISIVAKLGLRHWSDLAQEPSNKKWYGKLERDSSFWKQTILYLPSYCRDSVTVKALYSKASSGSEDGGYSLCTVMESVDNDDDSGEELTRRDTSKGLQLGSHRSKFKPDKEIAIDSPGVESIRCNRTAARNGETHIVTGGEEDDLKDGERSQVKGLPRSIAVNKANFPILGQRSEPGVATGMNALNAQDENPENETKRISPRKHHISPCQEQRSQRDFQRKCAKTGHAAYQNEAEMAEGDGIRQRTNLSEPIKDQEYEVGIRAGTLRDRAAAEREEASGSFDEEDKFGAEHGTLSRKLPRCMLTGGNDFPNGRRSDGRHALEAAESGETFDCCEKEVGKTKAESVTMTCRTMPKENRQKNVGAPGKCAELLGVATVAEEEAAQNTLEVEADCSDGHGTRCQKPPRFKHSTPRLVTLNAKEVAQLVRKKGPKFALLADNLEEADFHGEIIVAEMNQGDDHFMTLLRDAGLQDKLCQMSVIREFKLRL